jgi:hypothetical protein
MLSVIYSVCFTYLHMLSVTNKLFVLRVIMLNDVMLSVAMLSVLAPIY